MSEPKPARPPQVTTAAWLVMAGSVVVVLTAFSDVASMRSIATREMVEEYLATPAGRMLGIGLQGMLSVLQITAMVAAACAAATAILGYQILQRSRGARVALSVLAVPLLITGLVGGGIVSAVVVAATVMLWVQPARDWFAGRSPQRAPATPAPAVPAPEVPARDPLLDLPPPAAAPLYPTPAAPGEVRPAPAAAASRATHDGPARPARPAALVWACVLAWTFCGLALTVLGLTLVVMLTQPGSLLEEMHAQNPDLLDRGVSDAVLRSALYLTAGIGIVWSAIAAGLAVLAFRRVRWAGVGLAVSAGLAGGLCLLVLIGSVLMLVPMMACTSTVALLLRPEVRAWFADAAAVQRPPAGQ